MANRNRCNTSALDFPGAFSKFGLGRTEAACATQSWNTIGDKGQELSQYVLFRGNRIELLGAQKFPIAHPRFSLKVQQGALILVNSVRAEANNDFFPSNNAIQTQCVTSFLPSPDRSYDGPIRSRLQTCMSDC